MKKLALVVFALLAAGGGVAQADHASVPGLGYAHSGDGYIIVAEGENDYPVIQGYIGIKEDGTCHGAQTGDHNAPDGDDTCGLPE